MKRSAGIVPFRRVGSDIEILIAHPGGPLWARRDTGAWSIVKGEIEDGESPRDAARREFTEETGWALPEGPMAALGSVRLRSGKRVEAWAVEAAYEPDDLRPGTFSMEWPPRSGHHRSFPEIDRVAWCSRAEALRRLNPALAPFVERVHGLGSPS